MTTPQPKYFVGISKCGCVVSVMHNDGDLQFRERIISRWKSRGYVVAERDDISDFNLRHTCGKDGAK